MSDFSTQIKTNDENRKEVMHYFSIYQISYELYRE